MAVTTNMIAVALGVAAPTSGSTQHDQWSMWIDDAAMLIEARRLEVDPSLVIDQMKLDYVIREAVVAQVRHPDDATQVSYSVDDASSQRTYKSGRGRVAILDGWWTLLGLAPKSPGAFSFRPTRDAGPHLPWCSLMLGATYCSCGVDIAGYPIFETDGL